MSDIYTSLESVLGKGRVLRNEPLAKYTTFKLGGPAQYFFIAQTSLEVMAAVKAAYAFSLPLTILGGGSNVLISDKGLEGLVIRNESREIRIVKRLGSIKQGKPHIGQVLVQVDSGVLINQLVRFTCDEGLSGLEKHLGLPGTVGGALYMNSKWTHPISYVGDAMYSAQIVNCDGSLKTVDQNYFKFGYDQSILQKTHEVVLTATFLLTQSEPKKMWETANASMAYRKQTQPMGVKTAGCTFRNIPLSDALRIVTPNGTKSAGYLIDQVGLKTHRIGDAQFSEKHANFIYNLGNATSEDVKQLIDLAVAKVQEKFHIRIEPEIVLLGKF